MPTIDTRGYENRHHKVGLEIYFRVGRLERSVEDKEKKVKDLP